MGSLKSLILLISFLTGSTGLYRIIFFFLTSLMEVRKLNPLSAEQFIFGCATYLAKGSERLLIPTQMMKACKFRRRR
jgi:hypothetical protein